VTVLEKWNQSSGVRVQSGGTTGLQWVRGTGYIDLWKRLHRAEEELIQLQSNEEITKGALEDHLRLHGCTMESKDELKRDLRFAVSAINSNMAPYFTDEPDPAGSGAPYTPYPRALKQAVRRTINEYRDEQRGGVVQVRNRLLITVIVTGVAALLTLGLAVTMKADPQAIGAASAYFLVGAVLGLLYHRLHVAMKANNIVDEDYGLSTARLWATPLFSGVAAVAGVFLVAVVPNIVELSPATGSPGEGTVTAPAVTTADPQVYEAAPPNEAMVNGRQSMTKGAREDSCQNPTSNARLYIAADASRAHRENTIGREQGCR
jgi:hypothetical protein